jgi:serine/threonine protein kinase
MYDSQEEIDAFLKVLYHYRYVRTLGSGAFGIALLVHDDVEGIDKVFKLPKNRETTEALRSEGANLRKLEDLLHRNIIRLHQFGKVLLNWNGREQERYYLNMQYGGVSLRSKIGAIRFEDDPNGNVMCFGGGVRLPLIEALSIAIDVGQGLEAAHGFKGASIRMLHRDIKPDNILIDEKSGVARLVDFGIAKIVDKTRGLMTIAGTPMYMHPLCAEGQSSVQSDLYSLAVTIYEIVTGELPYVNFPQRRTQPPPPMKRFFEEIPDRLDDLVHRVLHPDKCDRPDNASELLDELRRIRASLQPLPDGLKQLARLPGGSLLCVNEQSNEQCDVRLIETGAPVSELSHQCSLLESRKLPGVALPLRHERNEQYVSIISTTSTSEPLAHVYSTRPIQRLDEMRRACEACAEAADVVAGVHSIGIVHGLLTPFCIRCDDDKVVVTEFGAEPILRARHIGRTSPPGLSGCEEAFTFSSPQLLSASSLPAVTDDVFSLGAILYDLILGEAPIGLASRKLLLTGGAPDPERLEIREKQPLVPKTLESILRVALNWDPQNRFRSATEFALALRSCRWPDDVVDSIIEDALAIYVKDGPPKDFLLACERLDFALSLQPGSVAVHRAFGILYLRNRSFRHAVDELEKVARIEPTPSTFLYLGEAYRQWNRQLEKAAEMFQRALDLDETQLAASQLAEVLWEMGEHAKAISCLAKAISLESDVEVRQLRQSQLDEWKKSTAKRSSHNHASGD